jgi:hypothetical protein
MKLNLVIIFFLISSTSNAQKNKSLDYINFRYSISITAFSEVEISINKNRSYQKTTFDLEANYYENTTKKNKKITISENDYNEIFEAIYRINTLDLFDQSLATDGTSTKLEFGYMFDYIKIELSDIDKTQINTNRKNFIEVIQLILKLAEIKIEDYN